MKRLFIGLGISGDAGDMLYDAVPRLGIQARLTRKSNYHLTLAFLGEHDDALSKIKQSMQSAAIDTAPLTLTVTGLGYFGRRENALLYAKVKASKALETLANTLRIRLSEAGELYDVKPFRAHITLARKADLTAIDLQTPMQPIVFTAEQMTLYHSLRVQGVLRYRPVLNVPFRKDAEKA